jgi:predicted RNA binding protein YcfA (HicA-like mRNA interferase family)
MDNVREAISGVLAVVREQVTRPESNIQILDISVTGVDLCRLLDARGWTLQRLAGSHHIYSKAGERKIISVPVHGTGTSSRGSPDASLAKPTSTGNLSIPYRFSSPPD